MHVWYKTAIGPAEGFESADRDRTFAQHARTAGGYDCRGYGSTREFFATYFDTSTRLQSYDGFLTAHLPKDGRALSIASGRGVNEMRLITHGFHVVCSDLEPVCADAARALFPGYRFLSWDALAGGPLSETFDAALCLSFVYLLDPPALDRFFGRVRAVLSPGGRFVLDSAGSPDQALANLYHDVVLPAEARIVCALVNLKARLTGVPRRFVAYRKHHGYRYADSELVAAAARHGFTLDAVSHLDFENEWQRMYLYRNVLARLRPVRSVLRLIGRRMPYVRLFAFRMSA